MKRFTTTCAIGTIACIASLGAQSMPPSTGQTRPAAMPKMESRTVTLSGCLTKGPTADAYLLTSATVSPGPAPATPTPPSAPVPPQPPAMSQPPATAMPPTAPPAPAAGTSQVPMPNAPSANTPAAPDMAGPGTWVVVNSAGVDLTKHVGHKVELTGSTADVPTTMPHPPGHSPTGSGMPSASQPTPSDPMKDTMPSGTQKRLTVQSVKHISPTCTM